MGTSRASVPPYVQRLSVDRSPEGMSVLVDEDRFLLDFELADRLGITRRSVWAFTRDGRLPRPHKLGRRATRWRWADVVAHLEEKKNAAAAGGAA